PLDYHLDLAVRLAPLRQTGVTFLRSGNVVHNLRRGRWNRPDAAFAWAERFDAAAAAHLAAEPASVLKLMAHADSAVAVPSTAHPIPLLSAAGLAAADEGVATPWLRGHALGSISMTCYRAGEGPCPAIEGEGAAGLPADVPAEQTNI